MDRPFDRSNSKFRLTHVYTIPSNMALRSTNEGKRKREKKYGINKMKYTNLRAAEEHLLSACLLVAYVVVSLISPLDSLLLSNNNKIAKATDTINSATIKYFSNRERARHTLILCEMQRNRTKREKKHYQSHSDSMCVVAFVLQ